MARRTKKRRRGRRRGEAASGSRVLSAPLAQALILEVAMWADRRELLEAAVASCPGVGAFSEEGMLFGFHWALFLAGPRSGGPVARRFLNRAKPSATEARYLRAFLTTPLLPWRIESIEDGIAALFCPWFGRDASVSIDTDELEPGWWLLGQVIEVDGVELLVPSGTHPGYHDAERGARFAGDAEARLAARVGATQLIEEELLDPDMARALIERWELAALGDVDPDEIEYDDLYHYPGDESDALATLEARPELQRVDDPDEACFILRVGDDPVPRGSLVLRPAMIRSHSVHHDDAERIRAIVLGEIAGARHIGRNMPLDDDDFGLDYEYEPSSDDDEDPFL